MGSGENFIKRESESINETFRAANILADVYI